MKELDKNDLLEVEGGGILDLVWKVVEVVHDVLTGDGLIGKTAAYTSYYRSQMPSNWTGHGY